MAIPPEDPTQPLPPAGPPPRVRETVATAEPYVVADDPAWRQLILDRIDALRTGLVLLGIVALAALGLAVWALIQEEKDRNRGGSSGRATSSEVADLRDRVDDLESRFDRYASKGELDSLSRRVDDLAGRPAGTGADNEARDSLNQLNDTVTELNDAVTDLTRRVEALEQSQ